MEFIQPLYSVNFGAVLLAAFAAFFAGGVWYGPLFGKRWMKEWGFNEAELSNRNHVKIFLVTLLLNLIMATTLSVIIGHEADFGKSVLIGFFAGIGLASSILGVFYLFENISMQLFGINGGFAVINFTIMGAVLGVMNS
jgi:hypothetical protein